MTNAPLRRDSRPRQPIAGLPDAEDQLFGVVTALTAQVAVLRERLDTIERLAERAGLFGPDEVEAFRPDAAAAAARDTARRTLIERVFRPIRDAAARTARQLNGDQP